MAQDAAFFAQLSHDANQVAAELIDTDEKLCEAEDRIQRLGVWMTEIEGKQECDPNLIEVAKCQRLECEKSANAHTDRLNVLWQQLPRLEQSASSIDGYRIDQFPVMASIRNEAGRNQAHLISHLALELNRIADMAHREAERLWGPADSVKQLTNAAMHCRNQAFNFVSNLQKKLDVIEDLLSQPDRYKRHYSDNEDPREAVHWVFHYCDKILVDAIARFNKATECKPEPLVYIQDATLSWHGRNLMVDRQSHTTACEAARSWCEIIFKKVQECRQRQPLVGWFHLEFLRKILAEVEAMSVSDMSAEIDREEQATLKALEPKQPAQPSPDVAAIVREALKQSEAAKELAEAERTKKPQGGQQVGDVGDGLEAVRSALSGQLLQIFDFLLSRKYPVPFKDLLDEPSIVWRNGSETSIEAVERAARRLRDELNDMEGTRYSVSVSRVDQRVTLNR